MAMVDSTAEPDQQATPSVWHRLKVIGLIVLCIILSGLGGIGVALGLMQSPAG